MDPVTLAIVSAIGVEAVKTTYHQLKELIAHKTGQHSELPSRIADVEADPASRGRRVTLEEEVAKSRVGQDPQVLALARQLLEQIEAQPGGKARVNQVAIGSNIAQAADHSHAEVHVERPRD
jgi:hypothetical protein